MKNILYKSYMLLFLLYLISIKIDAQSITIGSGTKISLDALTIALSGNWVNEGTFDAGTGTVIFNGANGNQTITNSSGETFYNLIIDKASGDVQLLNNVTAEGNITLTSGDIDLNGNIITLGSSALLSETAGNTVKGTSGYITATRTISTPSSTNIAGLGIVITSFNNLGSTVINRGHAAQTGSGNTGIKRYFDITPTNNTNLGALMTFYYDESELNGITESDLELFLSTDSGITWTEEGGTLNTTDNTVTLTGINSFYRWTVAGSTTPLPVELTSFRATVKDIAVTLKWETESEIKNYGFEVERELADTTSNDQWEKIGFVEGAGNSNSPKYYSFVDEGPEGGTKFQYRLKQIDTDGEYTYSDILDVEVVLSSYQLFQNFPNPFNPTTTIRYQLPQNSKVLLNLYDVLGREVATLVSEEQDAGRYSIQLSANLYQLASGTYLYRIQAGNYVSVKKLMLLK